jgi:hypothetical protein
MKIHPPVLDLDRQTGGKLIGKFFAICHCRHNRSCKSDQFNVYFYAGTMIDLYYSGMVGKNFVFDISKDIILHIYVWLNKNLIHISGFTS